MEPDDMPLHDLLGTGEPAEPGPDPLRAIVVRARRRHRRVAAGGVAVALIAGGAIGFAISNHSSPTTQTSTASAPAASGADAATSGAAASGSSGGYMTAGPIDFPGVSGQLTPLFTRTTDTGIALRVFRTGAVTPAALPTGCQISVPRVQVDASTAKMVGITFGSAPATHSKSVTAVTSQVVGQAEGDPTAVVAVATGPTVAQVQMVFTGGRKDSTPTSDGWAVLAASVPAHLAGGAALGTLTAMNSAGHPVGSASVTLAGYQPFGVPMGNCALPCAGADARPPSAATARAPVLCAAPPCGVTLPPSLPPNARTLPALRAVGAPACVSGGASGSSGSGSSGSGSSGAASSSSGSSGPPSSSTGSATNTGPAR